MSEKYKYEKGSIHLDLHRELHIGTVNGSLKDLMHDFFEQDAEEADVTEEVTGDLDEIHETSNAVKKTPEDIIRQCIASLMEEQYVFEKNGKQLMEPLFNRQNHWQAIYRISVDKKYCKDSDFDGFDLFVRKVMPSEVNKPYVKGSVKQISQTDFNKPFEKWKYDGETSGRYEVFVRMQAVAQRFKELLEAEGL